MEYAIHILVILGIYVILSVSLDLIVGYTGLLSLAHAAFYGVGAYVAALLALEFRIAFEFTLVIGIVVAAVLGVLLAVPSLRVRDDYFVIASFCFQVITFSILQNWVSLTGGPVGIAGIPQPTLFGLHVVSDGAFLALVAVACAVTVVIARRLTTAPFGRVLQGIREDEVFVQSLGKDVPRYKITVFMLGAAMAAVAGILYAHYMSFIDPSSFTVMESILVISMVIIGGAGSVWGPIAGAVLLVLLPEALRFLGLPSYVAANVRQMLYGALLVVCVMFRPQGLLGRYGFETRQTG